MTARQTDATYIRDLPARPEVPSIEPTLESLSDLAQRRDALRHMATRATEEATRIDQELTQLTQGALRALRALSEQLR